MPSAKRRSLWPREHGAYAQLLAPLLTALLVGSPTLPAALLAAAASFAFLANESLLVVLGHRGPRVLESTGPRARVVLGLLAAAALLAGGAGLALAPYTLASAGIAAIPTALLVGLAVRRAQHSLTGELLAALALPAAVVPVAVAGGVSLHAALELWAAWSVGYMASVVAVHRVMARNKNSASGADVAVGVVIVAAIAACIVFARYIALPLLVASVALVIWAPPAKRLRAIGVGLVVASVASIIIAVATAA